MADEKGASCMKKRSESVSEEVRSVREKLDNLKSAAKQARRQIKEMKELNTQLTEDTHHLARLDDDPGQEHEE